MNPSSIPDALLPLADDLESADALIGAAVTEACRHTIPVQDPAPRIERAVKWLRSGSVEGRLYRVNGRVEGIVVWESGHPAGFYVEALYLRPSPRAVQVYHALLERIEAECGPVALLPGHLAGLSSESEESLMRERGFAPFGRSEMRFPSAAPVPPARPLAGLRVRPLRPEDEAELARLHAAAFGPTFDFYLFQIDTDPARDSALAVRDMLGGRYGECLWWASHVAEHPDGTLRGGCVFVRAPYGPLLVSVHVDPAAQGRGIGRALVVASVRVLRERDESVIALNVTEGNRRAIALYERLGFVRTLGPDYGWYSRARVPVAPDAEASRPGSTRPTASARGDGAP